MTEQAEFLTKLLESLDRGEFIKLTFTRYVGAEPGLTGLAVRLMGVRGETKLSFGYRYATRDVVKNFAIEDGIETVRGLLADQFKSMRLFTISGDWELVYNKRMQSRLIRHKPSLSGAVENDGENMKLTSQLNDRRKHRYIEAATGRYLVALGIASESGMILKGRESKFRQINKFVEILDGLYRSSGLAARAQISVVDMGAGKGYLTFATYDFLRNIVGRSVTVTGVEARTELVDLGNAIAAESGFTGLNFVAGRIGDCGMGAADVTIALHACDTATDDAIVQSIRAQSSLIILSPCCHRQVRGEMERSAVMKDVLKFGILMERQAEIVTDRLRSLCLEWHGYHTKVFEFISTEETSKNLLITAVKQERPPNQAAIFAQMQDLKRMYGVQSFYLENLLFPEGVLYPRL
jgi:hypothetical protein